MWGCKIPCIAKQQKDLPIFTWFGKTLSSTISKRDVWRDVMHAFSFTPIHEIDPTFQSINCLKLPQHFENLLIKIRNSYSICSINQRYLFLQLSPYLWAENVNLRESCAILLLYEEWCSVHYIIKTVNKYEIVI